MSTPVDDIFCVAYMATLVVLGGAVTTDSDPSGSSSPGGNSASGGSNESGTSGAIAVKSSIVTAAISVMAGAVAFLL